MCNDLSHRYPWQTDAIVLQALTGLRRTESFQLKKSDLKYWDNPKILTNKAGQKQIVYGEIHIRPAVSKMGQEEWIPIIEPIKTCLDNIKGIPKRHFTYHSKMYNKSHRNYGLAYAKGLPWLFCSTQVQTSELFDSKYRFSSKTRLRTDHHCWLEIRREMKKRKGLEVPMMNIYAQVKCFVRPSRIKQKELLMEGPISLNVSLDIQTRTYWKADMMV